jgi:hypothetical protein
MKTFQALKRVALCLAAFIVAGYHQHIVDYQFGGWL